MSKPGLPPRLAAAEILHLVVKDRKPLTELTGAKGPLAALSPQERARAQSLATNTLRYLHRVDVVMDQFLQKDPPLKIRNALRLAATEMLVEGISPHAAVDAAVSIVRSDRKTAPFKGLTNAVARRIAEQGPNIWAELAPQQLPAFLRKPLLKAYGEETVAKIEAAHEVGAKTDITFKNAVAREKWQAELTGTPLANGSFRLTTQGQISQLPGFDQGGWWVQDAAATIPARILGDVSGRRILDLCAAPGGKTLQLAAAGAKVTALDVNANRMQRVQENLDRTALTAKLVVADALKWPGLQPFDAVLLDAPCSATGTIRRHPDLPFIRHGSTFFSKDIKTMVSLQQNLLQKAITLLKPGGTLVFSTCSLLREEGVGQIRQLLETGAPLRPDPIDLAPMGLDKNWQFLPGMLHLRPDFWADVGGMDGFFIARFTKR